MIPAREIRFVLVIDDYDAAAHLYREVFGLEVLMDLDEQGAGAASSTFRPPPSSWSTSTTTGWLRSWRWVAGSMTRSGLP